MSSPPPVLTSDLLPELNRNLLELLDSLGEDEWLMPTCCPGWSIKDIAAHLLDVDLGILSRERDGFDAGTIKVETWEELVRELSRENEEWVEAMRGLSPGVLCRLLQTANSEVAEYFAGLDPFAVNGTVAWAGPDRAPNWLHIAREYTERWHHQQQVREATGQPLLTGEPFFPPVIATFVRSLPRAYAGTEAAAGTAVRFSVTGPGARDWFVVGGDDGWTLDVESRNEPEATISIDGIDAWRLFTKSLANRSERVTIAGDRQLAQPALGAVAIIA